MHCYFLLPRTLYLHRFLQRWQLKETFLDFRLRETVDTLLLKPSYEPFSYEKVWLHNSTMQELQYVMVVGVLYWRINYSIPWAIDGRWLRIYFETRVQNTIKSDNFVSWYWEQWPITTNTDVSLSYYKSWSHATSLFV